MEEHQDTSQLDRAPPLWVQIGLAVLLVHLFATLAAGAFLWNRLESRAAEERIRYLAYFDEVTGLPNRAFVKELLNHALERAAETGQLIGLLFLDLDHFKRINDTLAHAAGDSLLR